MVKKTSEMLKNTMEIKRSLVEGKILCGRIIWAFYE